ncbi:NUDIX hydrolase domain-like protein [Lactifluus volemus]|nr:NUDIX hydrolase domain-like protein [Lactifluus volemus]
MTGHVFGISDSALASLSTSSRVAIQRLLAHSPEFSNAYADLPISKLAAVLVLLYEGAGGELRVLLTTRSKELRSHPGQTALPGGKMDKTDAGVVETAFREANEEIALPLYSPHVHTLCTLDPFVSRYMVVVTPVVAFLDDLSVLEELRAAPGEVAHIFDHPLEALLDPELVRKEALVLLDSEHWPYEEELHNFTDALWLGSIYRLHRFRSTASPVKGLTADILMEIANIAYARDAAFERWGPGQLKSFEEIQQAISACSQPHWQPLPGNVAPTATVLA